MPDELCRVAENFADLWRPKTWEFADTTLYGPGGWALRPHDQTIEVYHVLKFGAIGIHVNGSSVLEAVNFLGRTFGSSRAIITHELLPLADLPLLEVGRELEKTWRQASSWEMLWRGDVFEHHCWMLVDLPIDLTAARGIESHQST